MQCLSQERISSLHYFICHSTKPTVRSRLFQRVSFPDKYGVILGSRLPATNRRNHQCFTNWIRAWRKYTPPFLDMSSGDRNETRGSEVIPLISRNNGVLSQLANYLVCVDICENMAAMPRNRQNKTKKRDRCDPALVPKMHPVSAICSVRCHDTHTKILARKTPAWKRYCSKKGLQQVQQREGSTKTQWLRRREGSGDVVVRLLKFLMLDWSSEGRCLDGFRGVKFES